MSPVGCPICCYHSWVLEFLRRRKAKKLLAEARSARANGDEDLAISRLERAIELDCGETAIAAITLSGMAEDRGDLTEAARQLLRAHAAQKDAILLLAVGEIYRDLGTHADAVAAFDQAMRDGLSGHHARRATRGAALSSFAARAPDAEARLLAALDSYSSDDEVRSCLSRHYADLGRMDDASRALLPILRAHRDDVEAYERLRTFRRPEGAPRPGMTERVGWPPHGVDAVVVARLFDHLRIDEVREALALRASLASNPSTAALHALVFLRDEKLFEAASALREADDTPFARYVHALLAIHETRESDAAVELTRLYEDGAPLPNIAFLLGARREIAGDDGAAATAYQRALQNDPDDAEVMILLSDLLRRQGRPHESADLACRAYRTDPVLLSNCGRYRLRAVATRRLLRARACAMEAFAQGPTEVAAAALARVCNEQGDYRRVLDIAAERVALDVNEYSGLRRERGYARYALGDLAVAAKELAAAFDGDPEDYECRVRLGEVLAQLGKTEAAEAHLDAAIEELPNSFHAHATKAILLSMRGEFDAAEVSYRAAMRADPHAR